MIGDDIDLASAFTVLGYGTMTATSIVAAWQVVRALDHARALKNWCRDFSSGHPNSACPEWLSLCGRHVARRVEEAQGPLHTVAQTATMLGFVFTLGGLIIGGVSEDENSLRGLIGVSLGTSCIGLLITLAMTLSSRTVEKAGGACHSALLPDSVPATREGRP